MTIIGTTNELKIMLTAGYESGLLSEAYLLDQKMRYENQITYYKLTGQKILDGIDWVEKYSKNATPEDVVKLKSQLETALGYLKYNRDLINHIDKLLYK